MQTLCNNTISNVQSPMGQPRLMTSTCTSEDRREKLSRYWSKKSKRNFGRKIKVNLVSLLRISRNLCYVLLHVSLTRFLLRCSTLAGRRWQTASRGFEGDSQRRTKRNRRVGVVRSVCVVKEWMVVF